MKQRILTLQNRFDNLIKEKRIQDEETKEKDEISLQIKKDFLKEKRQNEQNAK